MSFFAKMLGGGDAPSVAPAPPPPDRSGEEVAAKQAEERRKRLSAGRASTMLAGETADEPSTATKKLLG